MWFLTHNKELVNLTTYALIKVTILGSPGSYDYCVTAYKSDGDRHPVYLTGGLSSEEAYGLLEKIAMRAEAMDATGRILTASQSLNRR